MQKFYLNPDHIEYFYINNEDTVVYGLTDKKPTRKVYSKYVINGVHIIKLHNILSEITKDDCGDVVGIKPVTTKTVEDSVVLMQLTGPSFGRSYTTLQDTVKDIIHGIIDTTKFDFVTTTPMENASLGAVLTNSNYAKDLREKVTQRLNRR